MKELDFDELDRAVSSLMGSVPKTVEPPKQDDVKVLTIASTLTDDKPPVLPVGEAKDTSTVDEDDTPAAEPVLPVTRVATPAVRRNGRFMDVIHPGAAPKSSSTLGVSRQGVTIAPRSDSPTADEVVVKDEAVSTLVTAYDEVSGEGSESVESHDAEPRSWPDPLDFARTEIDEPSVEESPAELFEQETLAEVESNNEVQPEPLTSPFIPDAKVEKRPLGSPAPELASDAPLEAAFSVEEVADDEPVPAVDEPLSPQVADLPEELQGDLMAIESDSTGPSLEAVAKEEVVAPKSNDAVSAEPSRVVVPAAAAAVAVPSPAITGPVSIPQQYREEPSTGDATSGSIYDTASYHQPLEHPAKKKSGWLWVVWVLALLVVGAGGGALAYFYLLQ